MRGENLQRFSSSLRIRNAPGEGSKVTESIKSSCQGFSLQKKDGVDVDMNKQQQLKATSSTKKEFLS